MESATIYSRAPLPKLLHRHATPTNRVPSAATVTLCSKSRIGRISASPTSAITSTTAIPPPSARETVEKDEVEADKKGNLVPLYRCILGDHLTPVLAYQGLWGTHMGRYSVVGAQPAMEIVTWENMVTIMNHNKGHMTEEIVDDPMQIPRSIMEGWSPQSIDELLHAFCGGWVGYFSYDTIRYVEKKKLYFSTSPKDDRNLPDRHLGLYNDVLVFDHVKKQVFLIHWVQIDQHTSIQKPYQDGKNHLEAFISRKHANNVPKLSAGSIKLHTQKFGTQSSMTSEEYKKAVLQAKEHIIAGDIFQIVQSQHFEEHTFVDPFEVYRALRIVNPSPYMSYLQARGCILVASSPENLTRVEKRTIIHRPLAGTVRRGRTEEDDKMLEKHLLHVDLGRNDVGKVSKPGSVKVEKLMNVERYSHVMHISSTITGELLDHLTSWDALGAALPLGTVSGAPKVRAKELIDQMEVTRRGPYSGGFGGISFTGDMDIAIALWTIVFPTGSRFNTKYSYKDMNRRQEVSKPGTMKVEKLMNVERYSHVMHISSTITTVSGVAKVCATRMHLLVVGSFLCIISLHLSARLCKRLAGVSKSFLVFFGTAKIRFLVGTAVDFFLRNFSSICK